MDESFIPLDEGLISMLSIDVGGIYGVWPPAVLEAKLLVPDFLHAFLPSLKPKEIKNT